MSMYTPNQGRMQHRITALLTPITHLCLQTPASKDKRSPSWQKLKKRNAKLGPNRTGQPPAAGHAWPFALDNLKIGVSEASDSSDEAACALALRTVRTCLHSQARACHHVLELHEP